MTRWISLILLYLSSSTDVFSPDYPVGECPENEKYTGCSSSSCFEAVCGVPPTPVCTRDCKAGCQCKQGFARKGEHCVPLEECTGGLLTPKGVLRHQSSGSRCVSTEANKLEAGSVIIAQNCNKASDLQLVFGVDGAIHVGGKPELCLSITTTQATEGSQLMLAECSKENTQKFLLWRGEGGHGTLRPSTASTLCLEHKPPSLTVMLARCSGNNDQLWQLFNNGCLPAVTAPILDYGIEEEHRGWYDVQGCGICRDYCRWVGSGSGGDPAIRQTTTSSYWSCALAGLTTEFTPPGYFTEWNFTKCSTIISEQDRQRSAAAARDLVLQAELPTLPQIRSSAPTEQFLSHTNIPITEASTTIVPPPNATNTSSRMHSSQWQATPDDDVTSAATYAIPLGVILGVCLLVALALFIRKVCCKKQDDTLPPPPPPIETAVPDRHMAVPSAPVMGNPSRVIMLHPIDDPPPPYHAIDTLDAPPMR